MTPLHIVMTVVGGALMLFALVIMLWPRWVAAPLPAFIGFLLLHYSTAIFIPSNVLLFWGVATVFVVILRSLLPKGEPDGSGVSNRYIGLSAIAGALAGMAIDPRVMIAALILGAIVGAMAYSKTPRGRWLAFPSTTFWQFTGAKGFPAVITTAQAAITIQGLIA